MIIVDILLFNVNSVFIVYSFLKLKNKPWTFRKADSGPSLIPLLSMVILPLTKKRRTRAFNSLLLSVNIFTEDYTNKCQTAITHY